MHVLLIKIRYDDCYQKQSRSNRSRRSLSLSTCKRPKREKKNDAKVSFDESKPIVIKSNKFVKEIETKTAPLACSACCDPVECHQIRYCEWLELKYRDDPMLQSVSKDKWRETLHAEYRLLSSYGMYKLNVDRGESKNPIDKRRTIPACVYYRLEALIEDEIRKQSIGWHNAMLEKLGCAHHQIQKDFVEIDAGKRKDIFVEWVGKSTQPKAYN